MGLCGYAACGVRKLGDDPRWARDRHSEATSMINAALCALFGHNWAPSFSGSAGRCINCGAKR